MFKIPGSDHADFSNKENKRASQIQPIQNADNERRNVHTGRDIVGAVSKEDPRTARRLAVLARSLRRADCARIQVEDFWQVKKRERLMQPVAILTAAISE